MSQIVKPAKRRCLISEFVVPSMTRSPSSRPAIGTPDRDGYLFVTRSADPNSPLHKGPLLVAPCDFMANDGSPARMTWKEMMEEAEKLSAIAGKKVYVPTGIELGQIYNVAASNNLLGFDRNAVYWAAGKMNDTAECQRFDDGLKFYNARTNHANVRFVCGG